MQRVGSRTGRCVNDSAGRQAVIGGGVAGDDEKFLDRVYAEHTAGDAARGAGAVVVDADAVELIVVSLRPVAADADVLAKSSIGTVVANAESLLRAHLRDARFEQFEGSPVAAVQWQLVYGVRVNHAANFGGG